MTTVNLFDAKTHLSRIVEDLLSGKEKQVIIARRGKPVVVVTPVTATDVTRRIGLIKGRFDVPDDIDGMNPVIAKLFSEGIEA